MNHHNIPLLDIALVGKAIAGNLREAGFGSEMLTTLLERPGEYLYRVHQAFPEADSKWLRPEVREAVVDIIREHFLRDDLAR